MKAILKSSSNWVKRCILILLLIKICFTAFGANYIYNGNSTYKSDIIYTYKDGHLYAGEYPYKNKIKFIGTSTTGSPTYSKANNTIYFNPSLEYLQELKDLIQETINNQTTP